VAVRPPRGCETLSARVIAEPDNVEKVAALVRICEERKISLAPLGAGRSLAILRTSPVVIGVSLARMASVVAYEPDDMTVVAEAGLTLGALQEHMVSHRQHLPLDPPNPAARTLGAIVAAARSGPLRLSEGTPRDMLIGVNYVGHGGRIVHGGGRVVKNVAGYDLMKVMTGSFGTLGIITEVTFRVRPIPERCRFVRIGADTAAAAFAIARRIADEIAPVHLDLLSPQIAERARCAGSMAGRFIVALGIAGSREETDHMAAKITGCSNEAPEIFELATALRLYRALRDVEPAAGEIAAQIAVPPAALGRYLEEAGVQFRAHAGSGVAELFIEPDGSVEKARAEVERLRAMAVAFKGNLMVRAMPAAVRGAIDLFGAPEAGVMGLMRRLKQTFDPAGIFNPSGFIGGI
jgi:glycolate oxidase FAD binding subunit